MSLRTAFPHGRNPRPLLLFYFFVFRRLLLVVVAGCTFRVLFIFLFVDKCN